MKIQLRYKPHRPQFASHQPCSKDWAFHNKKASRGENWIQLSSSALGVPREAPMPAHGILYPRRAVGEGSVSDAGRCVCPTHGNKEQPSSEH